MKIGDLVKIIDDYIVAPKWPGVIGVILYIEDGEEAKVFHPQMVHQPVAWWNIECLEVASEGR